MIRLDILLDHFHKGTKLMLDDLSICVQDISDSRRIAAISNSHEFKDSGKIGAELFFYNFEDRYKGLDSSGDWFGGITEIISPDDFHKFNVLNSYEIELIKESYRKADKQ